MRSLRALLVLASVVSCVRGSALAAQTAPRDSSAIIRFGGDVTVPTGAREGAVVVLHGDATIAGDVRGVVVLQGDAHLVGGHVQDLTVVNGRATLSEGARVDGDVHLLDADITVDSGSVVAGRIERGVGQRAARHFIGALALIGLGVFLAFVLGGVLAAAVVPEPLRATGAMLRSETGPVLLATAVLWLGFPLVAGLLIPTLIGLPIGLGYLLFVMPTLGLLGLIVAGTWLGEMVIDRISSGRKTPRPTVAAAVGITLLLLMGRVPLLGIVATVLMLLGSGALALRLLRTMRARPAAPAA